MIVRVFRMRVKPGMHDSYEALVREQVVPVLREAPGLLSLHVGRPMEDPPVEFLIMSIWQDLPALRAFMGHRWRDPLVLPGEAQLISESIVDHYDLIDDLSTVMAPESPS